MIYLDYTAHMPPSEEALQALYQAERFCVGNANAHHAAGETARQQMNAAHEKTASLLAVLKDEIIFTSGASESNNTAIQGIAYAARHFGRHIITTPMEHPSVSGCLTSLQERGYEIDVLPVGRDGRIDLKALAAALRQDTVLVTLCAVDSELGIIQPIREAAQIIHSFPHCHLHIDVTQAVGKIPFDLSLADTGSFSGHKFGGITGSGVLYKKHEIELEPLIHGGVSTSIYRSGTPAIGLACSLSVALEHAMQDLSKNNETVSRLNNLLRKELAGRNVRFYSPKDAVPHILNIGIDGIKGITMRDRLSAYGACVSVKSACSVENTPSRAVYAITKNRRQALESFRLSLCHLTTEEEISRFLDILDLVLKELKQ